MSVKWQKVKLGDVTTLIRGKYITRDSVNEGDIPVILGGREPAYYCDTANHDGPCVVISRSGASAGFVTYWNEPICVTDGFLFEATDLIDIRYLYFCLKSQQQSLNEMQNGAGIPHVTGAALKSREIPFPPLPVQKKIASILSAYDDLIENNRRRIAIHEEMARTVYRKRFGGKKANGTIADVCEEVRRSVKPGEIDSGTPYIGLEHMPRRSISLCDWESVEKVTSTKHGFKEGEILFGKIRPYFHKVGLAFVDGVASSDAIVIRPLSLGLRNYVLFTVSSDDFVAAASQGMKEGSKMPRADWNLLLKYSIAIPKKDDLNRFNEVIEPMMGQLKALCFANRKLAAARDELLPKLMSGKLEAAV